MNKQTFGHVIGWVVVLALCTAGAAQALPGTSTVDSGDIVNGQVKRADLGGNAVTGTKVADGSLGASDLAFKSVGTDQLTDRSVNADVLGLDSVRGFHVDNGSLSGLDLAQNNSLTGAHVNEQSLNLAGNCGPGTVHGWTKVNAYTLVEDTMYTIGGYNCAGGTIRVYMEWPGIYRVYFDGNPSAYGIASMEYQSDAFNNTISMYRDPGSAYFTVRVTDASTAVLEGGGTFVVMLF